MNACIDCKHCKIVHFNYAQVEGMYCKYEARRVDYVTGMVYYEQCHIVRQNREVCDHWEQGGIKAFFRRIFKKLKTDFEE